MKSKIGSVNPDDMQTLKQNPGNILRA